MKTLKTLVAIGLLTSTSALAQTCNTTMNPTAVAANFNNVDGVATDTRTSLMWMRCAIGQTYDDQSCIGNPTQMDWQAALKKANETKYGGYNDWRLPNVRELATIIERGCVAPAIDLTIFPGTNADDYWTSTTSISEPNKAWIIGFYNGSNSTKSKLLKPFVRLVRNTE